MACIALTREQSRRVDRLAMEVYGFSGLVLMENAGRGVVDRLESLGIDGAVVICCGRGNNGGDGFVIARHLDLRGYEPKVLLYCDPAQLTGDAAANYQILEKTDVPIHACYENPVADELQGHLKGAAWVVDALLGTGARGEPRPPLDAVIDRLNASGIPILAVDVPSGLDCDSGEPANHTIRAAHTCTFVTPKVGFSDAAAGAYLGEVHVLDIGTPAKLVGELIGSEMQQRSDLLIREVQLEDAEAIAGILNPIIESGAYSALDTPVTVEAEHRFICDFPRRGLFHVAEDVRNLDVVGFQTLEPYATYTHAFDHVAVVATFVDLGFRGRGVGRNLSEATFESARGKGYEKIVTFVRADNRAALQFYRKLGFGVVGTAERQARINGNYVDEVIIEMFLS